MRGKDFTSVRLIDFKYARVGHRCKYGDRCAREHCGELDELEYLGGVFFFFFKCQHICVFEFIFHRPSKGIPLQA